MQGLLSCNLSTFANFYLKRYKMIANLEVLTTLATTNIEQIKVFLINRRNQTQELTHPSIHPNQLGQPDVLPTN